MAMILAVPGAFSAAAPAAVGAGLLCVAVVQLIGSGSGHSRIRPTICCNLAVLGNDSTGKFYPFFRDAS